MRRGTRVRPDFGSNVAFGVLRKLLICFGNADEVQRDLLVERALGQFAAAARLRAIMVRPHSHLHAGQTNALGSGCRTGRARGQPCGGHGQRTHPPPHGLIGSHARAPAGLSLRGPCPWMNGCPDVRIGSETDLSHWCSISLKSTGRPRSSRRMTSFREALGARSHSALFAIAGRSIRMVAVACAWARADGGDRVATAVLAMNSNIVQPWAAPS